MTRQDAENRLAKIIAESTTAYDYEIVIKEWSNYGKNRLYISIIETRENSKHYAKYDFGFIDMDTNEYHAGKKDITRNFNLAGDKFEEKEEIKEEEKQEDENMTNEKTWTPEEIAEVFNCSTEKEPVYAPEKTVEEIKEAFFKTCQHASGDYSAEEIFEYQWNHPVFQIAVDGRKEFFDNEKEAKIRMEELTERFGLDAELKTVPNSEKIIYTENHRVVAFR